MNIKITSINMFTSLKKKIQSSIHIFSRRSLLTKLVLAGIILFSGYYLYSSYFKSNVTTTAQTITVKRSTIRSTVTASGIVVSANNSPITTLSSGVITAIYVKNGDTIKSGDKIAELDLDLPSKQRYAQALAAYQNAKNAVESAKSKKLALQAAMFTKWDSFKELAESDTYTNSDKTPNYANRTLPEFHIPEKEWLAAESDYKNQEQIITQTQSALSSAWYELNESSPVIYAPISGTVTGLALQVGTVIPSTITSSTTSTSKNQIAHIATDTPPTVQINVTEIDVNRIQTGQTVTITLDAFPDTQFQGSVLSVDTVGSTTSGVTTYPTTIAFTTTQHKNILPNMAASAAIIISEKKNVLTIPLSTISTKKGKSTVQIKKNNDIKTVEIQTGLESDTEIEVVSGIREGDVIITKKTTTDSSASNSTRSTSPFSPVFGPRR